MKLFGRFGKDKAVPFPEFREQVRLAVRRTKPGVTAEPTETGFNLYNLLSNGKPVQCNLRNLYFAYTKAPSERDTLIQQWIDSLVNSEEPEQGWAEARRLLRPVLKTNEYVQRCRIEMRKQKEKSAKPRAEEGLCEPAARKGSGS